MGRGGPLDHPELREVERLLDTRDLAGAQRLLAQLGASPALADGTAYLTTRLLRARGRLDSVAVADRLRDLLSRSPSFPEALAFLAETENGPTLTEPPPGTVATRPPTSGSGGPATRPSGPGTVARPSNRPPDPRAVELGPVQPALDTTAARNASWPPLQPSNRGPGTPAQVSPTTAPPTVRASPQAPKPGPTRPSPPPDWPQGGGASSPPSSREGAPSRRRYAPLPGMDSFVTRPRHSSPPGAAPFPAIPRAPALPQFRANRSAPSYVPAAPEPGPEPAWGKSLLPRDAGRYSQMPATAEVVAARGPRPSRALPRESSEPVKPTVPHTPARIRSSSAQEGDPSLFEIATWIDEGQFRQAIAAINRAGAAGRAGAPEHAVLRARALAGAGYLDQAFDALERLESEPLLEPELRAACARLFVELGSPERGLQQARRALEAEPLHPAIRQTFALAAVRVARRTPSESLVHKADQALGALPQGREGLRPALHLALKACILCASGDPERAIAIAQRALGLDSRSPDALAAVAEASARLGHAHDAQKALARLAELSPDEAEVVAGHLTRHGIPTGALPGSPHNASATPGAAPLWSAIEIELYAGHRTEAVRTVESTAQETVRRTTKSASQSGLTGLATIASTFLTTAPVLSSFAPYDLSLWSLRRLEAALAVLYGPERRPRLPTDDAGLVLLAGTYLGEALRLAHGGRWEGGLASVDNARIIAREKHWHPFRIIASRIHQGERAVIGDAVKAGAQTGGGAPWQSRIQNPVAPPTPWAPSPWPRPSQIGVIGRSLSRSPVGRFCQDLAESSLDRSTSSLVALDTYLALIAPVAAPRDPDAAWTRRIAVLVGGYLGETLREVVGGDWSYGVDSAEDATAFRLVLSRNVEATPVAHVLERVIGERSSSLVDYAKTLIARVGRG